MTEVLGVIVQLYNVMCDKNLETLTYFGKFTYLNVVNTPLVCPFQS